MKSKNSIPPSALKRVTYLYWTKEWTAERIGAKYDVCAATVCKFLKDNGVPRRESGRRQKINVTRAEMYRLYVIEEMTTVELAEMFGVTDPHTVREWIIKFNIPRRGMGPRKRSTCKESGCDKPVLKIQHSGNKAFYGTRCKYHRQLHYANLNRRLNRKYKRIPAHLWRYENEIPERVKQGEKFKARKERECLKQGKQTLVEIRALLKNPSLLKSHSAE